MVGTALDDADFNVGCAVHDLCYVLPYMDKDECDAIQLENHKIICDDKFISNIALKTLCYFGADTVYNFLRTSDAAQKAKQNAEKELDEKCNCHRCNI